MKRFRMLRAVAFAALLLMGAAPARAMMIYSTLGPGDSYGSIAWGVGREGGQSSTLALPFTVAGGNFKFQSVEVPLDTDSPVTVSLLSDSNQLPGTVLEQITILEDLIPSGPYESGLFKASSVLHPQLTDGTTYWIAVHGIFNTGWRMTSPAVTGLMAASVDEGTSWYNAQQGDLPLPALRVNGDPASTSVPEPSSLTLAALGLVTIAGMRWRSCRRTD